MSEILTMFKMGVGAGAWLVGAALVVTVALPVFGLLFSAMAWMFGLIGEDEES